MLILPYIEAQETYKFYRMDEPWDGPNNRLLADRMPKVMAFSGTKFPTTTTNYLAVTGKETMWPGKSQRSRSDIKDDVGQTILIVENNGLGVHWMEPRDLAFDTMSYELNNRDGISSWYKNPAVVTADGQVLRLWSGMTAETLRAVLTVAGGEKLAGGEHGNWEVLSDGRTRERANPKP